jgi:hypothetical protein
MDWVEVLTSSLWETCDGRNENRAIADPRRDMTWQHALGLYVDHIVLILQLTDA